MRLHIRIAGAALIALASLSCSELGIAGKPKPKDKGKAVAQDDRMQWWREARFGMFVHWGLYAIPAGTWNGQTDHAEWIRETARIPVEEYEKFQQQFNPTAFDADQWVRFAKAAGMQYLVVTSKHHDGFCMWDSSQTEWDVTDTPFKRDVLKELSEACMREKIRFCTYHSIMDWHHPDYLPRRSWEDRPAEGADFDRYQAYLHAQVTEIIERYHPSVMWFDGEWENTWNHERGVQLFELCRSLDPKMIVNNRVDVHRAGMGGFNASSEAVGDFSTPEQEVPPTGMPGVDWETCLTMNDHWGYNSHDSNWKTTQELIRTLVDVASKGGNLLLNIGPKADGTFPTESIERLEGIGRWMKDNGKAIHGTIASPFDSLPWGRCTVRIGKKKTKLYLLVFDWPADGVLSLSGLGNPVKRAYTLGKPDKDLDVRKRDGRVQIQVPKNAPDATCSVVVLEVAGPPLVYRTPRIVAPYEEFVEPLRVVLDAGSQGLALHYTTDGREPTRFSSLYKEPILIAETCKLQVRAFHDDNPVSDIASKSFRRAIPLPAQAGAGVEPGLIAEHFALRVDALPTDWSALVPDKSETVAEIALPGGAREEDVVRRWRGFVDVPADDVYLFALLSDDGSRLAIDGKVVVDNDGPHTSTEKQGAIALAKGRHALDLQWFNRTGGAELSLRFAELGGELRALSAAALTH